MKNPTFCFGGPLDGQIVEYAGPSMAHAELLRSEVALNALGTGGSGQTTIPSDKRTQYRAAFFGVSEFTWRTYVPGDMPDIDDAISRLQETGAKPQ